MVTDSPTRFVHLIYVLLLLFFLNESYPHPSSDPFSSHAPDSFPEKTTRLPENSLFSLLFTTACKKGLVIRMGEKTSNPNW